MSLFDLAGDGTKIDARYADVMRNQPDALLYDVLDDDRLRAAGRLIWEAAQRTQHFAVGSSGVGYALTAHWRASGMIAATRASLPPVEPVRQLLVLSGSAAPMTAQQIAWAAQHGFVTIRAATEALVQPQQAEAARRDLFEQALAGLSRGDSVLIYSATGPDDPSIGATRSRMAGASENSARVLGTAMGRLARELLMCTDLRRVVIAGGDTSSYATQELGLYGLEMLAELTPGAPLCRAYSADPRFDGLQIALKGGQMGTVDYFGLARGS
ncbi:MAG: nucleotide-binding domain containing protein [Betaproteobacteria bacterium]